MDPELLKAFVAVADHRSFTRAAAAINRTQSAVSMQIRRFEERLGVELFRRTTVNVSLTLAGESLLDDARRILVMNDEAVNRLQQQRIDGLVRIGVMEDYGALVMPPLLAGFAAAYPRIHVAMETGLTTPMLNRLGDSFDLVIAMHPEGRGDGEFLRREEPVWAAGASHRVEQSESVPVALSSRGCLFRKWAVEALDAAGRSWRLAFVSESIAATEAIAAQGLAVTVTKSSTFPRKLRRLSERDGMPRLPMAAIRLHRAANLTRAASLMADHLVSGIAKAA